MTEPEESFDDFIEDWKAGIAAEQAEDATRNQKRDALSIDRNWPKDVSSIGIGRLDFLGVDINGALYWDGKPIEMRRSLILSWRQRIGAVVVTVSALAAAIAAGLSAYCDLSEVKPAQKPATERQCAIIQRAMLHPTPRTRTDLPDVFQALGCLPQPI